VLSTFFGLGILLLSLLQKRRDGQQSGLDTYIFGQAASLGPDHVLLIVPFGLLVLVILALLYKEFKLLSFDASYTSTLGFSARGLEIILSFLIVIGVMISLRAIGVVLTTALMIMPAAAARQWTDRLSLMLFLAMTIGVASGIGGAIWSENLSRTPTGPAVILVATAFLGVSLTLAPRRGVLWSWVRQLAHRRVVRRENLLSDFFRLGEKENDWQREHTAAELASVRGQQVGPLLRVLRQLTKHGQVEALTPAGPWRLTPAGLQTASRVMRNHRLWELYLTQQLELAADHVHRDAEDMEHALPTETVEELEAALDHPDQDRYGRPLPPLSRGG
jgi:manganese/zinc/iron transport system permease protein